MYEEKRCQRRSNSYYIKNALQIHEQAPFQWYPVPKLLVKRVTRNLGNLTKTSSAKCTGLPNGFKKST
jgi:hypothetical protein